ncbi:MULTISPECIES: hypothetical protein [Clostridium]|nr:MULTISPECIES: hypothetical protein [Clostridium]APQ76859.1 hypothetical protein RSJ10_2430 [Clostridium botulinum]
MNIRLKFVDILKLLFGKRILIKDNITFKIIEVKKGRDTYSCK